MLSPRSRSRYLNITTFDKNDSMPGPRWPVGCINIASPERSAASWSIVQLGSQERMVHNIMRTFCIMKIVCIQPTKSCYTLTAFTRSLENWKIYSESPIYLRASVCDHNTLEISQKTFSWDKAEDTQWDASWHPHHQWLHSRIKISSFPLTAPVCLPGVPSVLIEAMDKVASCIF